MKVKFGNLYRQSGCFVLNAPDEFSGLMSVLLPYSAQMALGVPMIGIVFLNKRLCELYCLLHSRL